MNAKLFVVVGKTTKRVVALKLPAVLGRSREADVTVAHPLISRRHCQISENNGLLMLRDLASLNGTMIDGRRVESAPLLPGSEFTIGPLTFHIAYNYDGDLESVPETIFAPEVDGTEAALVAQSFAGAEEEPIFEAEGASPAEPAGEDDSSGLAVPDFMALADAEPEEVLPAAPVQAPPSASGSSLWPPVTGDKRSAKPMDNALDEPMEVDSSLQSGGHRNESPWAVRPPSVEEPQPMPVAPPAQGPPVPPETPTGVNSSEKAPKPPAKKKDPAASQPAANPPKKPNYGDEFDPEFGNFLEGLE
jgi:predicted component of type VI protein secretion system